MKTACTKASMKMRRYQTGKFCCIIFGKAYEEKKGEGYDQKKIQMK